MKKKDILSIIDKVKEGDQKSESQIVNYFWIDVKNYIFYMTKDLQSTEELVIITFTKALKKIYLYNSDFDFKTWLVSIAHNTAIDYLRKQKIQFVEDDDYEFIEMEPSPEELYISNQDFEAFKKVISKLPPIYKKIIELHFIEDKKLREIAEEMDLSLSNVKVSLMRAKKLLAEIIIKR